MRLIVGRALQPSLPSQPSQPGLDNGVAPAFLCSCRDAAYNPIDGHGHGGDGGDGDDDDNDDSDNGDNGDNGDAFQPTRWPS